MARIFLAVGFGIVAGVVLDKIVDYYSIWTKPRKPRKSIVKRERRMSIMQGDAYMELESAGKIDWHLSPSDNAIKIIESILEEDNRADSDMLRISLVYVLDVLKSDSTQATVPVGLQLDSDKKRRVSGVGRKLIDSNEDVSDVVVDWLLANYTPDKNLPGQRSKKLTLKSVARTIKIALKLNKAFDRTQSIPELDIFRIEPSQWEQIKVVLLDVDEWDFDIWKLKEVTGGRPLQFLGWHLLNKWNLISGLKLNSRVVQSWLVFVEAQYQDNEYHSSTHAADVLQAVHHLLEKCGAAEHMPQLFIFALVVTAMIHDAGHDGLSNLYHQNAVTDRALTFNDQSVQENYHCMTIFTSMAKDPAINILASLDPKQAREVRRLMILMTLGTDMKSHFKHFQDFKGLVSSIGNSGKTWFEDPALLDQLCTNLLHAADLSNPCRPFGLARRWAAQVLEEFFAQGDRERAEGLPVSPLCSRDSTLMAASQIGFINFVVLPYYQALSDLLPGMRSLVEQVQDNLQLWKELESDEIRSAPPTPKNSSRRALSGIVSGASVDGSEGSKVGGGNAGAKLRAR